MRTPALILLLAVGALASLSACVNTNAQPCDSHQECIDSTGGELDYCGQEGFDLCCEAGAYKCGCMEETACEEDYVCFACGPDDVCAGSQRTLCLDGISGAIAGLTPVDG